MLDGDTTVEFNPDTDRWEFSGHLEPTVDDHGGWSATISLRRMAEDGATKDFIPVVSITPDTMDVHHTTVDGKAELEANETTDGVQFDGYSETDPRQGETRLEIDGEVRVAGGEE